MAYTRQELIDALRRFERQYGTVKRDNVVSNAEFPNRSHFENEFGTFSQAKKAAELQDIGRIYLADSKLQEFNQRLRENDRLEQIVIGLLMGDGSIPSAKEANCCLRVGMATKHFLYWLHDQFGEISRGVQLKCTAAEGAKQARESGFRPSASSENYHDIYEFTTRRLPYFTKLRSKWYGDGGPKEFPYDFELTPMIAKLWYCGDGFVNIAQRWVCIKCTNEKDRSEELVELFGNQGFSVRYAMDKIVIRRSETAKFLDWLGDPLPGFRYKWEVDNKERYQRLREMET